MADQVFDLTQTGQQVQDIINDANKVKGAGAQTTLTTESVLLKDVNGNYHKILKSSFTEAIRDTLAGLLVNNDKGTTINQIAAISNGDFGSITPANLASVLGVSWVTSAKSGTTNIDDVSERCFFVVLSSNQSANPFPFTPDSNHRAFGFSSGDIIANRRFQVLMLESISNPKFYFRTKAPSDTSAQWSSWKEVATV